MNPEGQTQRLLRRFTGFVPGLIGTSKLAASRGRVLRISICDLTRQALMFLRSGNLAWLHRRLQPFL